MPIRHSYGYKRFQTTGFFPVRIFVILSVTLLILPAVLSHFIDARPAMAQEASAVREATDTEDTLPEATANATGTIAVNIANVRREPSIKAQIIGKLLKGTVVPIPSITNEWYQVRLPNEQLGWVHASLFENLQPPRKPATEKVEASIIPEKQAADSESASAATLETMGPMAEIREIRYLATHDGAKLFFLLSKKAIPRLDFQEKDPPRVICYFENTRIDRDMRYDIDIGGPYLSQVQIRPDSAEPTVLRIIVELAPRNRYTLEPAFFSKEGILRLTIKHET